MYGKLLGVQKTFSHKLHTEQQPNMLASSHYETLGVPRTASMDEIKAAFRKLSKETHPDVAGHMADADRFKEISHAASILTNQRKKQAYDMTLQRPLGHFGGAAAGGGPRVARPQGPRPTNGFQEFMQTVFRPRNMILGSIAVYATVTTARYVLQLNPTPVATHKERVQAWKNPQTGEWEQPAPWDHTYRRLKPHLTLVPRDQVKTRNR